MIQKKKACCNVAVFFTTFTIFSGNLKYTVIRKESLALAEDIVNILKGIYASLLG